MTIFYGLFQLNFEYFSNKMQRDKQEANIPTERWKIKENRRRIVKKM